VNIVLLWRHALAADVAEMALTAEARRVLPRTTTITDPVAQVEAQLAERGIGRPGFSAAAAALFGSLRDVSGAELTSLRYDAGGLTAAVATTQGGDLALLQERIRAAGFEASAGEPRTDAGRAVVELTVRPL
jgi:hypothetical protein